MTGSGEILSLWQNLNPVAGLFRIWQNFELTLAILCYRANCQRPIVEIILDIIWTHWKNILFSSPKLDVCSECFVGMSLTFNQSLM